MEAATICNAARDGRLGLLKSLLEYKSKNEIEMLVSSLTKGRTPLIMACLKENIDVAVYLIKICNAKIDQRSGRIFGENAEVTPLWCAVSTGNLDLVKTLINLKASVNEKAGGNLGSPLFAACPRGLLDIAIYLVEHGADIEMVTDDDGCTCLMSACTHGRIEIAQFLLDCKVDIHKKDFQGNTALHSCTELGNIDLVHRLVKYGAELVPNSSGKTPLLFAAKNGGVLVVDFFMQHFKPPKIQNIDALEVLGASLILYDDNAVMGYTNWKYAMQLRFEDDNFPVDKPHSSSRLSFCLGETEVCTVLQLNELQSSDRMRRQALLIIERNFGSFSIESNESIVTYIERYARNEHFNRHVHLWKYAIDNLPNPLRSKLFRENCFLFVHLLNRFIEVFSDVISDAQFSVVSFPDILGLLQQIVKGFERILQNLQDVKDIVHDVLVLVLHFIGILSMLKHYLNEDEDRELRQSVYELICLNPRSVTGKTLLHFACSYKASICIENNFFTFPSLETVHLLLECNACPNAIDMNRNTPLHIVAEERPFSCALFMTLLIHGSHLDFCNNKNQTPQQLAQEKLSDLKPLSYINLQCLSAQAIQNYKIAYNGLVDKTLENFIDMH